MWQSIWTNFQTDSHSQQKGKSDYVLEWVSWHVWTHARQSLKRKILQFLKCLNFWFMSNALLGFVSRADSDWLAIMRRMPSAKDFESHVYSVGKGAVIQIDVTMDSGFRCSIIMMNFVLLFYVSFLQFSLKTTAVNYLNNVAYQYIRISHTLLLYMLWF